MIDWSENLCNMVFEGGEVPGDWTSAKVVPLCKRKRERTEGKNDKY